jgi:hypothetical protein
MYKGQAEYAAAKDSSKLGQAQAKLNSGKSVTVTDANGNSRTFQPGEIIVATTTLDGSTSVSAIAAPTEAASSGGGKVDAAGLTGSAVSGAANVAGVNLNLYKSGDPLRNDATLVQHPGSTYAIGAHGSPLNIEMPDGRILNGQQLANMLTTNSNLNYTSGAPILMISCYTGATVQGGPNFAQQLAINLRVPVTAPTDLLWIYSDGTKFVAPYLKDSSGSRILSSSGKPLPDYNNPGTWKTFNPPPTTKPNVPASGNGP